MKSLLILWATLLARHGVAVIGCALLIAFIGRSPARADGEGSGIGDVNKANEPTFSVAISYDPKKPLEGDKKFRGSTDTVAFRIKYKYKWTPTLPATGQGTWTFIKLRVTWISLLGVVPVLAGSQEWGVTSPNVKWGPQRWNTTGGINDLYYTQEGVSTYHSRLGILSLDSPLPITVTGSYSFCLIYKLDKQAPDGHGGYIPETYVQRLVIPKSYTFPVTTVYTADVADPAGALVAAVSGGGGGGEGEPIRTAALRPAGRKAAMADQIVLNGAIVPSTDAQHYNDIPFPLVPTTWEAEARAYFAANPGQVTTLWHGPSAQMPAASTFQ